ncbi:L-serine ammonia-lyase, iron-sulfur-dependent, subunit alpha [Proteiniclasticum sp. BAD-10]|uniref:L-serine dehydratase n=1 Tax=Proteiniclasticum sediminis TaxID=2804028 RepID=A0A941HRF4_9CLOT|nr:L-serine ammonia-lyase, iron-sulfur-dependent, subunit alpha [Proteiniclasticum sediminis]MBR0576177.1 L-serine ammonia-lyase, iron-sulfur-dependent, subunit alpha [Proteiniclasticum sediminis]
MNIKNGKELVRRCKEEGLSIGEFILKQEMEESGLSREEIYDRMLDNLRVMAFSTTKGVGEKVISVSGLIGGDAYRLGKYLESGKSVTGRTMVKAMSYALSCSEVNASMGKIVACPTAGACGILPAVIMTMKEEHQVEEKDLVMGLFASAGIGAIIAQNATISGAEGGCQAECGSAAAMAAAAVVEIMGGTPDMCLHAGAIVFKNTLGLVCDPIGGLVEVPCAKRNAAGAVSAMTAADMVLAGVQSRIPFDDTVTAMYSVGKLMPEALRETGIGGLAGTKTGKKLKKEIFGDKDGKSKNKMNDDTFDAEKTGE